jgi:uncharacterized protein involved in exopolysaccharide biosynthesis
VATERSLRQEAAALAKAGRKLAKDEAKLTLLQARVEARRDIYEKARLAYEEAEATQGSGAEDAPPEDASEDRGPEGHPE